LAAQTAKAGTPFPGPDDGFTSGSPPATAAGAASYSSGCSSSSCPSAGSPATSTMVSPPTAAGAAVWKVCTLIPCWAHDARDDVEARILRPTLQQHEGVVEIFGHKRKFSDIRDRRKRPSKVTAPTYWFALYGTKAAVELATPVVEFGFTPVTDRRRPAGTRHLHPRSSNTKASIIPGRGKGAFSKAILRSSVMTYCVSAKLVVRAAGSGGIR